VKIHVASKFKRSEASASCSQAGTGAAHNGLLAPPPATLFTRLAPPPSAAPIPAESEAVHATGADVNDDDFGDFEG